MATSAQSITYLQIPNPNDTPGPAQDTDTNIRRQYQTNNMREDRATEGAFPAQYRKLGSQSSSIGSSTQENSPTRYAPFRYEPESDDCTPCPATTTASLPRDVNTALALLEEDISVSKMGNSATTSRESLLDHEVGESEFCETVATMPSTSRRPKRLKEKPKSPLARYKKRKLNPFQVTLSNPILTAQASTTDNKLDTEGVVHPHAIDPDDDQWEVHALLARKEKKGKKMGKRRVEYLVRWKGFSESDNSWVDGNDIHPDLVAEYEVGRRLKMARN